MAEQRPDGGVTYLFADETERIALESRYNGLIDVQRETIDSLKEGVVVFGTDGRLKLFNKAFCEIWRMPSGKLGEMPHIGEVIAAAQTLHPDNDTWLRIGRSVTAFLDEREDFTGQMTRADGVVIDFALMPLSDGATLLTFANVTDAKRAEQALVERNEALVAADRLKTNFIGHISRELRTPLTSMIGFAEMLASPMFGDLNDKQREYLTDIMSSSKTLRSIIDDILDLATIDAGTLQLKLAPVGARALIDAAILGIRERAIRSRLTIDIAVADDVTEFMADEARMRQMLYNLMSNAVGFSKLNSTVRLTELARRRLHHILRRRRRNRHTEGSDRPESSSASKATAAAPTIAAPGLASRSSKAWSSCMAARIDFSLGGGPRHARHGTDSRTTSQRAG